MRPVEVDQRLGFIREVLQNLPSESNLVISQYLDEDISEDSQNTIEYTVDEE